jgi:acetylornithine deacetylase/succinyl-diaminopimelate desuccinylase-like protein
MQCIIRIAALSLGAFASLPAHAADFRSEVQHYRLTHEAAIVGELTALTRLKSVAADPAGIAATAHQLEDALKRRGFEVSELITGMGTPAAVFGSLKTPGAKRTVVFYAHYDGQHAANENLRLQNLWDGINTYAALMAELNW